VSGGPGAGDEAAAVPAAPLVVVGVSGRTGSPAALRWAVEEAASHGGRVRAVLAWRPPRAPGVSGGRPPAVPSTAVDDPQAAAEERVRAAVARTLGAQHAVDCVAVQGPARSVLLRQSREAAVLVLDSPRSSKLATPGAKLLAPQLVFTSACPVVVMPPPAEEGMSRARQATQRLGRAAAAAAASAGRPGLPPRVRPGDEG